MGEGLSKHRHFFTEKQNREVSFLKPSEIPFFDSKKDKIIQISTKRRITCAVTAPKGKVYFASDILASTVGVDNAKFGFTELPVDDEDLYKEIEFAPASPLKKKQSALPEKSEEDNLAEEKAVEFKKK